MPEHQNRTVSPETQENRTVFSENPTKPKKPKEKENENEKKKENEKENEINTPYYPPKGDVTELSPKDQTDFLEFWGAYPNKVGKKAALSAWEKLNPDAELRGKIMKALKEQKASDQWRRENGRYIPSPVKWLNQERWEDELKAAEQEGQYKPDFSKWELPDEPDYGGAHVIKSQEDVEEIFKDWDSGG